MSPRTVTTVTEVTECYGRPLYRRPSGVLLTIGAPGNNKTESLFTSPTVLYVGESPNDPEFSDVLNNNILQLGIPMLKASYHNYTSVKTNSQQWEHNHLGYSIDNAMFYWVSCKGDSSVRPHITKRFQDRNTFMRAVINLYIQEVVKNYKK